MTETIQSMKDSIKREAVLCIAFVCAAVSTLFVPADHEIAGSIDLRVLALLFCLMAAVAGLQSAGVLSKCASILFTKVRNLRQLAFLLIMLPFFASMLVTNDVALLAFVPFAILTLNVAGESKHLARIVVLQAVAANIGGMATPVGNPQNLFIYTAFDAPFGQFMATLLPFTAATFILLSAACALFPKSPIAAEEKMREGGSRGEGAQNRRAALDRKAMVLHATLFALCLASVVRILPYQVLFVITLGATVLFDRRVLARVDYGLLATFVCFFVFSGNMAAIPAVDEAFQTLMGTAPFATSVAASQIISNVPAAVLLAEFTTNWPALLLGVDLGGLGTPIASLASLIAMKLYLRTPRAQLSAFLKEFTVANVAFLALLCALYLAFKALFPA